MYRIKANKYNYINLICGLIVFALIFVFSPNVFAQVDYSRSYSYGGGLSINIPNPPPERTIIDLQASVDAGGVLGCDGLNLSDLVQSQFGGFGSISSLSEDLADAVKTTLFRESLTRVLANPQVASVLENLQGVAHARVALLQKRCNANEIFADATNKRLREEAFQKCIQEKGSVEICQRSEELDSSLEEVINQDKWSGSMHTHLCDGSIEDNCDWLSLVPNRKTVINAIADDKAYTPPLFNLKDISAIATDLAVDELNERVAAAEQALNSLGYARALSAATRNEPGAPEEQSVNPYTLYDHTTSEACNFSAERGIQTNMQPIMAPPTDAPIFPISGANITDANISSHFGPRVRPCAGCSSFHKGVDFAYPEGTGLVSAIDGFIREVDTRSCGGNQVAIQGNDGTLIKYLHMNTINPALTPGITIGANTAIGTVGQTGTCTTGAHLHFTVRRNNVLVDPFSWLGGGAEKLRQSFAEEEEDKHGLTSLALSRSAEDPESDFIFDAYQRSTQMSARIASTIACNISRDLHPHVFLMIAAQPGTLGPDHRADLVAAETAEALRASLASGDKGAIVHGLGSVYGYHAAVTVYTAVINEMSLVLASKNTGEEGMNRPLYNAAIGDLGQLKAERQQLINKFQTECLLAKRIAQVLKERDNRGPGGGFKLKRLSGAPLSCKMFSHIKDDGMKEIIQFATYTDEDIQKDRQKNR